MLIVLKGQGASGMSIELEMTEQLNLEETEVMADGVSGVIGARLTTFLSNHVINNNLGWVFNADTDFVIAKKPDGSDLKRRPDVAFCSFDTLPELPRTVVPVPPDLAVEVSSSRDETDDSDKKLREYRQAKLKLVWVVRPVGEIVEVYRDGKADKFLDIEGELDGDTVVPGFKLAVRKLFELPTKKQSA